MFGTFRSQCLNLEPGGILPSGFSFRTGVGPGGCWREVPARGAACYGNVFNISLTVSNSRSIWAFSMISGGDMAMVSPVVRISTPIS